MSAVAIFKGPVINGTVHFNRKNNITRTYINLAGSGLTPNGKQMFFSMNTMTLEMIVKTLVNA